MVIHQAVSVIQSLEGQVRGTNNHISCIFLLIHPLILNGQSRHIRFLRIRVVFHAKRHVTMVRID